MTRKALISAKELCIRWGISPMTLHRMSKQPGFPVPVRGGGKAKRYWRALDILRLERARGWDGPAGTEMPF